MHLRSCLFLEVSGMCFTAIFSFVISFMLRSPFRLALGVLAVFLICSRSLIVFAILSDRPIAYLM